MKIATKCSTIKSAQLQTESIPDVPRKSETRGYDHFFPCLHPPQSRAIHEKSPRYSFPRRPGSSIVVHSPLRITPDRANFSRYAEHRQPYRYSSSSAASSLLPLQLLRPRDCSDSSQGCFSCRNHVCRWCYDYLRAFRCDRGLSAMSGHFAPELG